jgi:RNA polymerase sigma-70 factor (ECF subfamily)
MPHMSVEWVPQEAAAALSPSAADLGDSALIDRSREGDAAAIALLVERHADAVYRIAFRLVGKKAEAEDIAQDVLMRMLSYREGWLSKTSFHVWLRRAVYNRMVDIHRKNRPWLMSGLDAATEVADGAPGQESALVADETTERVAAALLALPLRQRMAVTLCFYEQMSLAEAGEVLKVSVGAVESLLHRAKAALRQSLGGPEEA